MDGVGVGGRLRIDSGNLIVGPDNEGGEDSIVSLAGLKLTLGLSLPRINTFGGGGL